MAKLRDSTRSVGSVAQQPCHEEVCKKTPPPIPTGSCDYYKQRNENYIQRHKYDSKSGSDNPPEYYMDYGFKYCSRFKNKTYQKLSSDGKIWLTDTLKDLQDFMEFGVVKKSWVATIDMDFNRDYLEDDPQKFYTGIECRNSDFRAFAFATHPDAYDPEIMKTLPVSDLLTVMATPDIKEWLSGDTWHQAILVGERVGAGKLGEVGDAIDSAAEKAEEVFRDLASRFSRWDGE